MKTTLAATILALLALPMTTTAGADDVVETVHLVVTGGPNAGTFDASTEQGGCSYGYAGPGSWGNQLSSRDKDPAKFNSLQLIVPDAKKAAAGSKEFFLSIGFGPLVNRSAEYKVDTRPNQKQRTGSGTVTVLDKGATAKVTFSLVTDKGVKLEGTIDCRMVARNGT